MKLFLSCVLASPVFSQYAASLLGNVGLTTVTGVEAYGDMGSQYTLPVGTNIVGPFEAGFTSTQDFILAKLGCKTGRGYLAGGIDTATAELMVAKDCGVELPRWEGSKYISLLGTCGGHTRNYHFHERFDCLYNTASGGHSTQVGEMYDDKFLYGMYEHTDSKKLPLLDACGGHWGPTPDHDEDTYHYHVQGTAPFSVGCYGPNSDNSLVTVEQCRAKYSTCDGVLTTLATSKGDVSYDLWCPCYDANGSNTGVNIAPLPVFANAKLSAGPGGATVLGSSVPSTSSSTGFTGSTSQTSTGKMGKMASSTTTATKTKTKGGSMRIEADSSCSVKYQIRSAAFVEMCLDSTNKRSAFKKCDGENQNQMFNIEAGQIMKSNVDNMCLSVSMTFGPCAAPLSLNRNDDKHQIKLSTTKCMGTTREGSTIAVPCTTGNIPNVHQFRIVPLFDPPTKRNGFRVTTIPAPTTTTTTKKPTVQMPAGR